MNLLNLSKLSSNEILEGLFGIEWESLRVKCDGELSLTPHPKIFGDKLTNPLITTDFSESQIEIITPPFDNVEEAFNKFSFLCDLVNVSLPYDEYLWFQSIPCILPYNDQIPIAKYSQNGVKSQKYREYLAKKYGVKKQMISGVHFNFSFSHNLLKKLYFMEKDDLTFKEFKNNVYLKIARNYLRYSWLIIYLTGCSIASHKSFSKDCIYLMDAKDDYDSYYSTKGPSFRNASCGYKNLKNLYPSYDSIDEFTNDIQNLIDDGDLYEVKELYSQIRLKPKNSEDFLNSLKDYGIDYLEIRTLDINPFYKSNLVIYDMKFLHLFLIYMFVKEESDYIDWQKESIINAENTAELAYDDSLCLLKDGCEVKLKIWALEIINEMRVMCDILGINDIYSLELMSNRIVNPDLTYAKRLLELIKKHGYINTHISLSKFNKMISLDNLKNMDSDKFNDIKDFIFKGLNSNSSSV